jgi:predicted lipoprotein
MMRHLLAGMSLLVVSGVLNAGEPASSGIQLQALYLDWYAPRSTDFARDSAQLKPTIQAVCDAVPEQSEATLQQARQSWLKTLSRWEKLSAVSIGPLIERRSQRQIDFTPTRPRMIEKAVKSAPASLADMELVGTPAKGLPALEWLLWVKPMQPASAECRYALLLAEEIEREALALNVAYKKAAIQELDKAAANAALSELVNQWVGGLERLRWPNMEMPVRVAITSKQKIDPVFPRHSSNAVAVSWPAQWEALRTLAAGKGFSLEAALRAGKHDALADSLVAAIRKADKSMNGLQAADEARVLDAARELAALKLLLEDKVASALGIVIGFSDADGD